MRSLNLYMGYARDAKEEGACLVFAFNAEQARRLAWPVLNGWFDDIRWIDVVARRLRSHDYLRDLARSGEPHVIESPPVCPHCELWGGGPVDENGRCDHCYHDDEG